MKKRLLALFVALGTVLSSFSFLTACSATDTVTIGVSIYQYSDNFMALYRDRLLSDFAERGKEDGKRYKIIMTNGNIDPNEQANQVNTFIAMKVDLIILNPVLTSSCNAMLDKISQAGIPCVLINREPLGENGEESYEKIINSETMVYVGCKALQSGEAQGEMIFDLPNHGDINGDGTLDYIQIKGDPENPDTQDRTLYSIGACENGKYNQEHSRYVKLCEENGVSITPHAVLDDQIANWDQAKAEELVTNALNIANNKIEVIFCNSDSMALGALTAVQKKGMKAGEDVYIVGVDGLSGVIERIDAGEITGTVKNDYISQSAKTVAIALHFLNGGTKETIPHEEGKSEESEKKGYFWIDYLKYDGK